MALFKKTVYAEGYLLDIVDIDERMLQEAKLAAAQAEAAVILVNKGMHALEEDGSGMMPEFVRNMPLRVFSAFSQGAVTEERDAGSRSSAVKRNRRIEVEKKEEIYYPLTVDSEKRVRVMTDSALFAGGFFHGKKEPNM
ncbi:hypothetical protein AV654_24530 [Paenibacillus elgii]|uniref:Uncharacterized protein n=1 Tax=Paenibacillus elgii TaxID=189691 RepID=A0A163WAJ3_9BACL|nr:hypothetical protein [Paenibacillus elgii]KZE76086.1 hypothetical protein AV654_24530 [Paenibacillus elgii]